MSAVVRPSVGGASVDHPVREADHPRVRADWLALADEPVLDPGQPIIDPHHHLWDRAGWPYRIDDLVAELDDSGHDVRSTIFVECRTHYRSAGPVELRPLGEAEFVVAGAERLAGHLNRQCRPTRPCEALIGHADLRLGRGAGPVLAALGEAAAGRLRGIRHSAAWDVEPVICNPELQSTPDLMGSDAFRDGVAELGRRGLVYDAWVYHPQLHQVAELARACPQTTIVLDHAGGPLGIGRYDGRGDDVFREWRQALRAVAACPNVAVKIGGLAMRINGRRYHQGDAPPDSQAVAEAFRPWVETCIELFGPQRAMFESNFPVDKASFSYRTLWNAFKRLAAAAGPAEKAALFHGTAARIYRLESLEASTLEN